MTKSILDYPWEDRKFYTNFLSQTFHYVRHSTRLLAAAAADCGFYEPMQTWHERFCEHLAEELGHEKLALKDLERFGEKPGEEYAVTSEFYLWHYDQGPIRLMGYILALEETAAVYGRAIYERCSVEHGLTRCVFLFVHAKDDKKHVSDARKLVDMLKPWQQVMVHTDRVRALEDYFKILDECEKDR